MNFFGFVCVCVCGGGFSYLKGLRVPTNAGLLCGPLGALLPESMRVCQKDVKLINVGGQ